MFFTPNKPYLDSIEIGFLVEEQVNDQISSLWMIEKHEKTPVNEPGPLLKSLKIASESTLVNELLQPEFQKYG